MILLIISVEEKGVIFVDMILIQSKELISIAYNEEEHSIYVRDIQNTTHVFENQSKELFDLLLNSKQIDYFYDVCFKNSST